MPGTEVPNETFGDLIREVKGFLAEEEGRALYELALAQSRLGPCLEIGSYCGLSTLYLGLGVRKNRGCSLLWIITRGRKNTSPARNITILS